jgi:transposase
MSLHPHPIDPVPEPTARVAHAAFPKGSLAIRIRDELGVVYHAEQFAPLFPTRGQAAVAPWRLMLVTLLQFAEDLTDRQAADAVRGRIDWQYARSLAVIPRTPGWCRTRVVGTRDRAVTPPATTRPAAQPTLGTAFAS